MKNHSMYQMPEIINLDIPRKINTKIINFIGAPGAGKSTHAAALFAYMKHHEINCELVTEYAKDITWKESPKLLENQLYIMAKQHNRMYHLIGKVDYIITDSPLILALYYGKAPYPSFQNLVNEVYRSFDNITFFVQRTKKYNPIGRNQTSNESDVIGEKLLNTLNDNKICYKLITSDTSTEKIYKEILNNE